MWMVKTDKVDKPWQYRLQVSFHQSAGEQKFSAEAQNETETRTAGAFWMFSLDSNDAANEWNAHNRPHQTRSFQLQQKMTEIWKKMTSCV